VIGRVDTTAALEWIRSAVPEAGEMVLDRERPWAAIYRIPTPDGQLWFKACSETQAFEPRLTAELASRWPDRLVRVLSHDPERRWLLTADAGDDVGQAGNPPELWLRILPRYAELQIGEVQRVEEHLQAGVPDMRLETLPGRFAALVERDLPFEPDEVARLRQFEPRFAELCAQLTAEHPVYSIQHDDLHMRSLFQDGETLRILDWGDSSIAHPFGSLVVTFRFLEELNGLPPSDPWFDKLRDAYLEPWGRGLTATFDLAMRVAMLAQLCSWLRHRDAMPDEARVGFDKQYSIVLRRALARVVDRVV
jgi:hypothetical protein